MNIKTVKYIKSCVSLKDCPSTNLPEFSFIGRSNVGKSSLINALVYQKIAHTSSTPGKTQTLNFYLINEKWYLVDLPGYGYAKTSQNTRKQLTKIINEYLINRKQLYIAFILIDSTLPPQKIDLDFINNCGQKQIPLAIVMTKIDKERKLIIEKNKNAFIDELSKSWETLPPIFMTSSTKKIGIEDLLNYINNILQTT
ncbi:MAG TPA: ribosome biogenesis GTP-binding protein YihA/YsxC [Bacteroidales bacterium]|nr:ribosome biogenesis GTP-binding protein YihA/YsxC [Bacteroidales bacterium]HON98295.1 ribosome biogenesis GTP-binding protein YihA/YsxC [Bacteroidales bacterium]HOS20935.1 ribosome biogenesis GTP-binding protein YihA/YsxC [Bacteroidales bacterium]HOU82751.1 ribosome biogenesis GTP-binding protein YihA/YsxC [Bacteroidales bacterium]HPL03355.1 ribosome biogenesis GTP-binding protein YihA/YsxC [Bacteroidales bacterium]